MSAPGVDLTDAPRYARVPSWPAANDTESRLAAITAGVDEPTTAWVRDMCEQIDPRGQRNVALREAVRATPWRGSISATVKETEAHLRRYVVDAWPLDTAAGRPPDGCSAIRLALWRFAKLNDGDALGWRQILNILDGHR
jgi:hypothetical protein